jgi:hypothetical protein
MSVLPLTHVPVRLHLIPRASPPAAPNCRRAPAELRWRVFWRIGVVAFAGVGQTAPNLGDFLDSDVLYAGGAGLRFVASESERVNLGIDYARASDGDSAVYFRIGEAF